MEKSINKKYKIGLRWLNDKFSNLTPINKDGNIYYIDNNKSVIFGIILNCQLLIDYDRIWSIFESFFDLNDEEISNLLVEWVKTYYNLKNNKCYYYYFFKYDIYNPISV